MSKLNLILHAGAASVDRAAVAVAPTPSATDTWHPIPHVSLVDMLTERLPACGLRVVNEAHGMWKDASRYFGMFQVASDIATDEDFGLVVGLRNSHDKTFPAGLCMGSGVFVCDNLAFSAEIVIGRRHTKNIMRDLPQMVSLAVGRLTQARVDQERRLEAYKNTAITTVMANHLIIEAMKAKAINTTRVPKVVEQWDNPAHAEFDHKNLWRLFNGFTEVYKETSLTELPNRTTRLHGILDGACGLVIDPVKDKADLKAGLAAFDDAIVA